MTSIANVHDVGGFSGATRFLLDSQAGDWTDNGASLDTVPDGAQQLGSGLVTLEAQTDIVGVETCTFTLVVEDAADDGVTPGGAPALPFVAVPAGNFMTAADGADGLPAPFVLNFPVTGDGGQFTFTLPFHRCRRHVRVTTDVAQSNNARTATVGLEVFDGGNVLVPR